MIKRMHVINLITRYNDPDPQYFSMVAICAFLLIKSLTAIILNVLSYFICCDMHSECVFMLKCRYIHCSSFGELLKQKLIIKSGISPLNYPMIVLN